MSEQSDLDYYARRAEAERALAETSADPSVARLHLEIARRYEDIVAGAADMSLRIAL